MKFENLTWVERPNTQGGTDLIVMNRNGHIVVKDDKGHDRERYEVVYGAHLKVKDGRPSKSARCSSSGIRTRSRSSRRRPGQVRFKDIIEGTHRPRGRGRGDRAVALHHRRLAGREEAADDGDPDAKGTVIRRYIMPVSAHMMVSDSEEVRAGDVLAKIPRETTKTKDITGGLPRVVELFEARKPKDPAVISEIDGTVKYGGVVKGQRKILIVPDDGDGRGAGVQHPARRARQRAGRRARPRGRSADGRPEQPARHPARARREGAAEVPGERDSGGLPPPGREHQRQAHRGDHAADDAVGPRRGRRRHRVPGRRAGRSLPVHGRERAGHRRRRTAGARRSRCCSASPRRRCRPSRSSRRRRSRRPRASSPRPRSPERSTTCAG